MIETLRRPAAVPLLIIVLCLGALGSAFASQYWGGLQPCVLCVYQRYAYGAALACGVLALVLLRSGRGRQAFVGLAGLCFLAGAAIAFFHVGVEHKWWEGTAACHAPALDPNASAEDMMHQLLDQPFVACDVVPWSLFGLSMAGYNVLASLAFAALCFVSLRLGTRASRERDDDLQQHA